MTSFDCEILLVIVLRPAVMLFTGADLGGFVQRNCIKKNETSRHHDLASKRRKSHFRGLEFQNFPREDAPGLP